MPKMYIYVEENNQTVVCHYVVCKWFGCSHIDRNGIIQDRIFHSVLCIIHMGPSICYSVSGYEHIVIWRIGWWCPSKYHIARSEQGWYTQDLAWKTKHCIEVIWKWT